MIISMIVGFLITSGLVAARYKDLPERVEKLEVLSDTINAHLNRIEVRQAQQICISVSRETSKPWQECFR